MTGAQVLADMEARIRKGDYAPGEKLPSYRELAELYGIGTTTAQQVYARLQDRGLAIGLQGKGIYVKPPESAVAQEGRQGK